MVKEYLLKFLLTRASWVSVSAALISELLSNPAASGLVEMLMAELPALAQNHGDYLISALKASDYAPQHLKSLYHFQTKSDEETLSALQSIVKTSFDRKQVKWAARILLTHLDPLPVLESASADTAHPDQRVQLRAWQLLQVIAKTKPALLPPYLEELVLEYELVLAQDEPNEELMRTATKFWAALLPQLEASDLLLRHGQASYQEEIVSLLLRLESDDTPSGTLVRSIAILLGPQMNLSSLLEKPKLIKLVCSLSKDRAIGKLCHAIAARKAHPILLLVLLLHARPKAPIHNALISWIRSDNDAQDGEEEHLIDSSSVSVLEDLIVPMMILLAHEHACLDDEASFTRCKQSLALFFDIIGLTASNLSYLYALAVEIKRYQPALFLAEQSLIHQRSLYILSEMAQNTIRTKANWLHASLEAFPLPLRITDTALTPLEPELAARNLAKSYLSSLANRQEARKAEKAVKTFAKAQPSQASSGSSTPRRNPTRSAKLPAGTLEAILLDDDDEMENASPNEQVPLKRKLDLPHSTDFTIGTPPSI